MSIKKKEDPKTLTPADRLALKNLLRNECRRPLDENIMDEFLSMGQVLTFKRGEAICSVGTVDPNIYVILSGIVCRWRWSENKEVVDTFALPGTLFTAYHSYYKGLGAHACFEACCPTKVVRISSRDYDALIERSHEFAKWCLSMAQCQLYTYEVRDIRLSGNVKDRYRSLANNRPDIIRQVPLKVVAAYLGVSPQYLSTLRTRWLLNDE